jgi:hypothetical protein
VPAKQDCCQPWKDLETTSKEDFSLYLPPYLMGHANWTSRRPKWEMMQEGEALQPTGYESLARF